MAVDDFDRRHREFHDRETREKADRDAHDAELAARIRKDVLTELTKEPEGGEDEGKDDHEYRECEMAGKIVDGKDAKKPGCKDCGKPGFKDAAGKMQHERRGDATVYGGRRKDPNAKPPGDEKKIEEQEPDRRHFLHRQVFGGKAKEGARQ